MEALIQTKSIDKLYAGTQALAEVDFAVEPGKIIGLLGPNGSGKTTLMKILAGILQPTRGEIVYPGNAKRGAESKRTVSLLPDTLVFPSWMRVRDAFGFYRDMYPDYSQQQADEMIRLLELTDLLGKNIRRLSKGMQERVALALTFSRITDIYLLDEPLGGIDPVGKSKIVNAILAMQLENSAIVVSTHLVKDIERIFDSVYFISCGRIVFSGNCDEMREQKSKTVEQAYLEVFAYEGTV